MADYSDTPRTIPRKSATFDDYTLSEIRRAAATGIYDIRGGGSIGHMSAFMAQAGRLVVLGDAGADLGDSIYEARLYVRGKVASLGADCIEKEMGDEHRDELAELLARSGLDASPDQFRRYGSARKLYHFNIEHLDQY